MQDGNAEFRAAIAERPTDGKCPHVSSSTGKRQIPCSLPLAPASAASGGGKRPGVRGVRGGLSWDARRSLAARSHPLAPSIRLSRAFLHASMLLLLASWPAVCVMCWAVPRTDSLFRLFRMSSVGRNREEAKHSVGVGAGKEEASRKVQDIGGGGPKSSLTLERGRG